MALPTSPAERHRSVAATFARRVRGVRDWDAPSPVDDWAARDVVRHLVEWLPPFLESGTPHRLAAGPSVDEDPAAAWDAHAAGVQALLEDPATAASPFRHPRIPEQPLESAIDTFYTADVFMHTWDLSRSSGQEPGLDEDWSAELLAGMRDIEPMLRDSGQYGPAHPVAADASVQDRLAAFIGRDPGWRP